MLSDSCHSGSVAKDIFDAAVPHVVEEAMVDTPELWDEGSAARSPGRHVPRELG